MICLFTFLLCLKPNQQTKQNDTQTKEKKNFYFLVGIKSEEIPFFPAIVPTRREKNDVFFKRATYVIELSYFHDQFNYFFCFNNVLIFFLNRTSFSNSITSARHSQSWERESKHEEHQPLWDRI